MLGAVRDMDILQAGLTERIAGLPPDLVLGPVESTVSTEIAAQRKVASDALDEAMESERYRKLIALVTPGGATRRTPRRLTSPRARSRDTSRRPRRKSPTGWGRP